MLVERSSKLIAKLNARKNAHRENGGAHDLSIIIKFGKFEYIFGFIIKFGKFEFIFGIRD